MKRIILSALCLGLVFTSCKNQSDKQKKSEVKTEKSTENESTDSKVEKDKKEETKKNKNRQQYTYKSDNGENIDVSFFGINGKEFVKIDRADKDQLILGQAKATEKEAEYKKGNYKWIGNGDNVTFTDGKETMKLVLISPLQYVFTNGQEDIIVRYFDKNDERFVSLKKDNQPEITLEQTTAWAKGAEYGKEEIQWHAEGGEKGAWIENGKKSEYKLKD